MTPPIKLKNQPMRTTGISFVLALMMLMVLFIGMVIGVVGSILFGPAILGLDDTATALAIREESINATSEANQILDLNYRETQSALSAGESLLGLTATQSSNFAFATQTAIVISNAQQATQAAFDFQNTQIALQQQRTQVIIDSQATQAALDQTATAVIAGATQRP